MNKQTQDYGRHLTVDGVAYDVSNLFPATRPKEENKLVDLRRWRSEKTCFSHNHPKSVYHDHRSQSSGSIMEKAPLPSIDFLTRSERTSSQPGASYIRMVATSSQGTNGLKQPPSYSKVDSPNKQTFCSSPNREVVASPEQVEIKSPHRSVSDGDGDDDINPEDSPMVEIEPGVHARLRGSKETARAMQLGIVAHVPCICCTQEITCIRDTAYFLCPTCRIVGSNPGGVWGVGLGFIAYDED
jgi:hypothetical protein